MKEQEKLKVVLKKIITEAENYNIQSTEELLKALVYELSEDVLLTISD